jgi:hypothetical protein
MLVLLKDLKMKNATHKVLGKIIRVDSEGIGVKFNKFLNDL